MGRRYARDSWSSQTYALFAIRTTGHKSLDGSLPMARREMGVSLDHAEGLPPPEVLDREEINAFHGQSRGEGVSEVVEAEILDPGPTDGPRDGFLGPPKVPVAFAVRKHENGGIQGSGEPSEDGAHCGGQRDVPSLAVLRAGDGQHPGPQVDVLPAESKELALAKPRVQQHREPLTVPLVGDGGHEPCFFLV